MPWIRLDDNFDQHPKFINAGPLGMALWVSALAWCNRTQEQHDSMGWDYGYIPAAKVRMLLDFDGIEVTTVRSPGLFAVSDGVTCIDVADHLVQCGIFEEAECGYVIHGYDEFQRPEYVAEVREKKRAAGRVGGLRSAEVRSKRSKEETGGQASASASAQAPMQADAQANGKPVPVPVPYLSSSPKAHFPSEPLGEDEEEWISKETAHRMATNPPRSPDGSPGWHKYRTAVAAQVRSEGRPTVAGRVAPPSIGARVREPDEIEAASARAIRLAGYDDDAQEHPSVAISDTFPAEMGHDSQDPYLTVMSAVQLLDEYDPNDPF